MFLGTQSSIDRFGRVIAVAGFAVLSVAGVQFLLKNRGIITTGLYSVVRHPQHLGILVMTLGLTVMCIQFTGGTQAEAGMPWFFQGLGYISLAVYEEHCLLREHKEEYQQYRQRVPFIFPLPRLSRVPEPLISIMSALFIAFLLAFVA